LKAYAKVFLVIVSCITSSSTENGVCDCFVLCVCIYCASRELRGERCFDVAIARFSRLRFYYCSPDTIYSTMNTEH
jgi:hypothetical protein